MVHQEMKVMEVTREESQMQLLDVEVGLETQRHTPRPWRWAAAALAVSLCVAAAVLLTWRMQDPDQSQGGSDLQLKLREVAESDRPELKPGSDKDAIHLEGRYNKTHFPESVLWSSDTGPAFSQGGLELVNNRIVIPRDGLYFVYSQASFTVNCHAQAGAGELVQISHGVNLCSDSFSCNRESDSSEWKELMSAIRPTCVKVVGSQDSGKRWHNGIYLGGVFKLQEGDELQTYTKKSNLPSLAHQPGKTFFGAFAL